MFYWYSSRYIPLEGGGGETSSWIHKIILFFLKLICLYIKLLLFIYLLFPSSPLLFGTFSFFSITLYTYYWYNIPFDVVIPSPPSFISLSFVYLELSIIGSSTTIQYSRVRSLCCSISRCFATLNFHVTFFFFIIFFGFLYYVRFDRISFESLTSAACMYCT